MLVSASQSILVGSISVSELTSRLARSVEGNAALDWPSEVKSACSPWVLGSVAVEVGAGDSSGRESSQGALVSPDVGVLCKRQEVRRFRNWSGLTLSAPVGVSSDRGRFVAERLFFWPVWGGDGVPVDVVPWCGDGSGEKFAGQ